MSDQNTRAPVVSSQAGEVWQQLENARMQIFDNLRRLGYAPSKEQFASSSEELKRKSAQYRLRDKTEKPISLDECTIAVLEALVIQGSILAHDGDGVSCIAQIIWAQHERAEAASPSPAPGGMGDLADEQVAKWHREWHWKDCERESIDHSIYPRDLRMLKAFIEHCNPRIAAQSAEVRERTIEEWRPAKTAPKDGKPFLAFFPDGDFTPETGIDVIWWEPSEQRFLIGDSPIIWKFSHWRSLPVPPRSLAQVGGKL